MTRTCLPPERPARGQAPASAAAAAPDDTRAAQLAAIDQSTSWPLHRMRWCLSIAAPREPDTPARSLAA